MATPPIALGSSRFELAAYDHNGEITAVVPYNNIQGESFLNKPHQLRCNIPYRAYSWLTPETLYPGMHELFLFDNEAPNPLFAGPIWTAIADSSSGVLNVSAQCPLSYLAKRTVQSDRVFTAEAPANIIADLITYVNAQRATNIGSFVATVNASVMSQTWKGVDSDTILDIITNLLTMLDGTDIFSRSVVGGHTINIYGGKLNPTVSPRAWEYGGVLKQFTLQVDASTITNDYKFYGSNGLFGAASNPTKQAEYDALYSTADRNSDLVNQAALTASATTNLQGLVDPSQLPTIVVKDKFPQVDFDFGDQFTIAINDGWAQYNDLIRIVGWQYTIGQQDNVTTNIYTNDTSEV